MIQILAALLAAAATAHAQWDASRFAWYTSPGTDFNSAGPIGNGRLGALVYGSAKEKIQLNENSVWNGLFTNRVNSKAKGVLSSVRTQLMNGQITDANNNALPNMVGNPTSPQSYSVLAELDIDFGHNSTDSPYTRYIDTYTGTAWTTYNYGGVNYTREVIASYPDQVLAMRYTAGTAGKLDATIDLVRTNQISKGSSVTQGIGSISLTAGSGGLNFNAQVRVSASGGSISASQDKIFITGATTVDIFFDAESIYRYSDTNTCSTVATGRVEAAVTKGYLAVKQSAISDHAQLMGRVSLDLGASQNGNQPTNVRLSNYKNNPNADVQLATLLFNFGRHLLISSSRDTGVKSLPANLQGLWNDNYSPAWGSKYTTNINIEMNYWPANPTNLAETHKALFDLLWTTKPRAEAMASDMYGCGGAVSHHNVDLWGDSAPTDNGTPYTIWPMGLAWLSLHTIEHYRFTGNDTFLRNDAWPILQDVANFYFCYLFKWDNYYTTGPSLSPENTFIINGGFTTNGASAGIDLSPQMDNNILWEVFNAVIETCTVLSLSDSACSNAKTYISQLRPAAIGSYGQILEWRREYGEAEPGMRHFSPLFALHPGTQFAPLVNQTLANAAGKLLDHRMSNGAGSTGWSRTWAIALYARLFNGNTAWSNAVTFIQTYPLTNLFNSNSGPPMQIDGNFGFVSGITEMLLQSHANNVLHLLPALPSSLPTGSVTGLMARGGFVVNLAWANGQLTQATVTSNLGKPLTIRVQSGVAFSVNGAAYTGPVSTSKGSMYTIKLA